MRIPLDVDRAAARAEPSACPPAPQIVALLPGSRRGEVTRLAEDFAADRGMAASAAPGVSNSSRPWRVAATREIFSGALARVAPEVHVKLIDGQAQTALIAANAVMVASGTASLEAALVQAADGGGVPAGSVDRLDAAAVSIWSNPSFSRNRIYLRIIASSASIFRNRSTRESLGAELLAWLDDAGRRAKLEQEFVGLHVDLKRDASARAAQAILALLRRPRLPVSSP